MPLTLRAVDVEQRHHGDIAGSCQVAGIIIVEQAIHHRPPVGNRDEAPPVRGDLDAGQAAEIGIWSFSAKPATIAEHTDLLPFRVAVVQLDAIGVLLRTVGDQRRAADRREGTEREDKQCPPGEFRNSDHGTLDGISDAAVRQNFVAAAVTKG